MLSHYQGWFDLPASSTLELVTISTDASFVLVDGKMVVAWPIRHGFQEERSGKYRDSVELPAGCHRLEYYNAYTAPAVAGEGMRCTSTIDTINAFIERKELDFAERVLPEIEAQAPI